MEVNINNAFRIFVKLTWESCAVQYSAITEKILDLSIVIIHFLLERPLLTTSFFSFLLMFLIIALSVAFIIITGVLVFIIIILLIEGLIFIIVTIVFSMTTATVFLFLMVVVGVIPYKLSLIDDLAMDQ